MMPIPNYELQFFGLSIKQTKKHINEGVSTVHTIVKYGENFSNFVEVYFVKN